jgi:hypothetical protein
MLSTVTGLASQVTVSAVPNPAIDASDAIDVIGLGGPAHTERHLADAVTHSLDVSTAQHIEGRSVRTTSAYS